MACWDLQHSPSVVGEVGGQHPTLSLSETDLGPPFRGSQSGWKVQGLFRARCNCRQDPEGRTALARSAVAVQPVREGFLTGLAQASQVDSGEWVGQGSSNAAVCPGSLDCALKRRARCPPGAHVCGPCLQPFQEDQEGLCVPRMRRPAGENLPRPRLEDEIDFLAQELARQEPRHSRLTAQPQLEGGQQHLEPAATLGLSERRQGPNLGLPSTRGAPAPTVHTSLGSPVSSGPVHMSPLEPRGGRGDGLALGQDCALQEGQCDLWMDGSGHPCLGGGPPGGTAGMTTQGAAGWQRP
ncbi:neural proliferation differentiation and control protein 1 [Puma concolor]|uniref:Neural proliferation differentiation and control protein 1 n=1 Tax=Puma concolor TaxID=9696 RepID=A0A6P6HVF0_PUMCO|nr:neural proliferation differentiation and control protein 1 [Puma concolor]